MSAIWSNTSQNVARAAERLKGGGLVGMPTETVYGLAGDAANGDAVAAIYETKGRPRFNPLIVHVPDLAAASTIANLPPLAATLARRFWPGALTLVVPLKDDAPIASLVTAGLQTVAIRVPHHPVAKALLTQFGGPIVAPSANRSGRLSPTLAAHVAEEFGDAVPVLDGGPCQRGVESTIIGFRDGGPVLLRPGAIAAEDIEAVTRQPLGTPGSGVVAPGMLVSHYAPNAALRLDATSVESTERLLGFGGTPGAVLDLSPAGSLREAAANLFAYLRQLDAEADTPIAVAPIPPVGLGLAINDRLMRAAAPRD
ncbi:L-threonylcarbamoyladenylate synthase [Parvularcula sp. LCG005]|uniref:L-threonylcarbamoyladenylate synthase n=1 Tax=Parvularcula sp. LCG005 TaxID=3078805 RepID=UPI0029429B28|nr:L-threonylcarbamoyladenylate synthase [Parvularcula sp. LCG005]WOI54384.1 L-threonylcarbamoyladenylate synthase [Parvularcula sp. LCG005]